VSSGMCPSSADSPAPRNGCLPNPLLLNQQYA
jgi:hypothetical protein